MSNSTHKTKRKISAALAAVFVLGLVSLGLFARHSYVQAADVDTIFAGAEAAAGAAEGGCAIVSPGASACPATGLKNNLATVGDKIAAPAFRIALIQMLLNLSQFVLNRIAYEAAVAIASAGTGQETLFYNKEPKEAWKNFGLEFAGEAVGSFSEGILSEELGIEFNLCDPGATNPLIDFSLAVGIKQKYSPDEPKCDILEVGANWEGFFSDAYNNVTDPKARQEAILTKFAESLKPGKNELSATLRINLAINQKVHEQKMLQLTQQTSSEGYKNVTDFITGDVKTPNSTMQRNFEKQLEDVHGDESKIQVGDLLSAKELIGGLALTTASTFTNTLLSSLMNRVYTGLFEADGQEFDPFDLEGVASGGREAAQERFADVLATNPISTAQYNALSEFVICPIEAISNRGLYNCVMDANFLAAVARGNAGTPVTVQEAIDDGLLEGNWPLIPSTDKDANQDPYCYTYGFCHGNMVKLRKARVIPIGWEIAAERNSNSEASLQDVIDGFNICTEEGGIGPVGSAEQWCHLVDPNWVLKYPETQCRAITNGELRVGNLNAARASVCVDAPSCIGEDNDGSCSDGYGYCVEEQNVWRFRGSECPAEYASCLSFENTQTGDQTDFLVNTVDYSVCGQDNAGCRWYRTNKYFEDAGTVDSGDDTYEWLATGDEYLTADRDDDWDYYDASNGISADRVTYEYTSDAGVDYSYASYAYEDRIYVTHDVQECDSDNGGCTQLFEFSDDLVLNNVMNPSFEDDEDEDGYPDNWLFDTVVAGELSLDAQFGSVAYDAGSDDFKQFIPVKGNAFYTLSFYARADDTTSASTLVGVLPIDEDGGNPSIAGLSYSDGTDYCGTFASAYTLTADPTGDDFEEGEWTRFECTYTMPADTVMVQLTFVTNELLIDAVQFEIGEDANTFTDGYNTSSQEGYYKIAPDYLGCNGDATDPAECDGYAQVCSAQEVGCSLYAPEDGDPSVPAIISSLDECPSSCVGYTTYKQEQTQRESSDFPLYFIADRAAACSQQYVGCDAFTSLGSVEEGGEGTEYFTDTRSCLSPDIADGTDSAKTPATYFTWEGSDNEGYQLKTWYLLQSNYSANDNEFLDSGFKETDPELAPCVNVDMSSENEVECADTDAIIDAQVWANDECDEHDDIFENPDCREYFDGEGNTHYRLHSMTISIDEACTPYRMEDSNQTDCQDSGGFWASQGFCRYYVLSEESTQCPATQSGCREFTGGSGRNASTILDETFEEGTYDDYVFVGTGTDGSLEVSNESVATDGLSLHVTNSLGTEYGFETVQIYLDSSDTSATYDEEDEDSCTDAATNDLLVITSEVTDTGCYIEYDADGNGIADESCTIADGQESCGVLTDSLVGGKTFVLEFWAKGSGALYVSMINEGGTTGATEYDMNDIEAQTTGADAIELTGSWKRYSLGPLDTSDDDAFDENAVLRFTTEIEENFYIDNIALKQTQENVTVIKDSWVVPSTCDQTPSGAESDQYYLGCEAYTDQNSSRANIYQFTNICSEEVVGCEGFYNTHNSESLYTQVFNARCGNADGTIVSGNKDCEVDDVTYCTITSGTSFCTFDVDQTFETPLPSDSSTGYSIIYGPEARVISADTPVYIIASEGAECKSAAMGCTEVGEPTYNQTQTEVDSFKSTYIIDLPADYDTILCNNEALFCEEWKSTQDGNFYFKDPLDKACEYRTGVSINNVGYQGWFREGTEEPCYWTDTNGDGKYSSSDDSELIKNGDTFGVWRNGDEDYDGWVAQCENKYDLCTEFIDVVDTGGGINEEGQSYYFTNDELLDEELLTDSQRCEGRISQKFGCALFNNTTISELLYSTSTSYVYSIHADVLNVDEANALVDPVSCAVQEAGMFEVSDSTSDQFGLEDLDGDGKDEVNLCARRCVYDLEEDDLVTTDIADHTTNGDGDSIAFESSCLGDVDCSVFETYLGNEVKGRCENVWEELGTDYEADYGTWSEYELIDDANEVIKVARDRSCSAWLACSGSKQSWNTDTNQWDTICEEIGLCKGGILRGNDPICTQWDISDPEILTTAKYTNRDVNWTGYEISGLGIPNQLPVEHYSQLNVEAEAVCVNNDSTPELQTNDSGLPIWCASFEDCPLDDSVTCENDTECVEDGYTGCNVDTGSCYMNCQNSSEDDDLRLVYNAGSCDTAEPYDDDGDGVIDRGGSGNGGSCSVGFCEDSGIACSTNDQCNSDEGEGCVVGYCQAKAQTCPNSTDCSCNPSNTTGSEAAGDLVYTDCDGAYKGSTDTPICDPVKLECVDVLTSDETNREACIDIDDCGTDQLCSPSASSTKGSCFNNRCLSDFRDEDGLPGADELNIDDARSMSCRGYPEIDSPWSPRVVTAWTEYDEDISANGTSVSSLTITTNEAEYDIGDDTSLELYDAPYTYIGGFQDSNTCALVEDEDGNIVLDNCLCSYDKAEYGQGLKYKYYDVGTGLQEVSEGLCSGGRLDGIPCINDDDCSVSVSGDTDFSQSGSCVYANRVDTVYGWDGYCIETDTSIQTLGSSDVEDQACLSWLPVDQLFGSTDLYAKHMNAGYALENTFYCADVAIAADLYTTSFACAEVLDNNCNGGGDWSNFKAEATGEDGQHSDCVGAVQCPVGYFAVMTGCGDLIKDYTDSCQQTWGDNDCPYFCVPKLSYRDSDSDNILDEACEDPKTLGDFGSFGSGGFQNFSMNIKNDPVHKTEPIGGWTDTEVYVLNNYENSNGDAVTYFQDAYDYYKSCQTTGLLEDSFWEFLDPWTHYVYIDILTYGGIDRSGFRNLYLNFDQYLVCESVVQVASSSIEGDDSGPYPFDSYNAAWTDRLWSSSGYVIDSGTDDNFSYAHGTNQTPFGAATSYEQIELGEIVYPLEVVMCEDPDTQRYSIPTVGGSCDDDDVLTSSSGIDARAYRDVHVNEEDLGSDKYNTDSDYCVDNDCDYCLDDDGMPSSEMCNYDNDEGASIYCDAYECVDGEYDGAVDCDDSFDGTTLCSDYGGTCDGGYCDGGDFDGINCSINYSGDYICQDGGGSCIGECVNGPNNGLTCGSDAAEINICEPHYCVPMGSDSAGTYTDGKCRAYTDSDDSLEFVYALVEEETESDAIERISQLFQKVYGYIVYSENYADGLEADPADLDFSEKYASYNEESNTTWGFNSRYDVPAPNDAGPVVVSVGDCNGSECFEGDEGRFNVGEQTGGTIDAEANYRAAVSFFMYADSNQMPIRRVVVDWGNDFHSLSADVDWPTESQTSSSDNNFYKNHRGLNSSSTTHNPFCGSADEWGLQSSACSTQYVSYTYDYTCTQYQVSQLSDLGRECEVDDEGRLLNSPCTEGGIGAGACVFQPRVHVMDNWGWCTGTCDSETSVTGDGCFTGLISSSVSLNECDIDNCPGGDDCEAEEDGGTTNPWVNWDGYIIVTPD